MQATSESERPARLPILGPFRIVVEVIGVMLLVAFGLRGILLIAHVSTGTLRAADLVRVFAIGLRFDLLVAIACVTPLSLLLLVVGRRRAGRIWRGLFEVGWSVLLAPLPLLCIVEFLFFDEFDSRLNYVAFEYLVYPSEVCCNIQQSYPVGSLTISVVLFGTGLCLAFRRRFLAFLDEPLSPRLRLAFPLAMSLAGALLLLTSDAAATQVTGDRVANECAANGVYSFLYHAWTCRFEFDRLYLTLDRSEAHARVRRRVAGPRDQLVADAPNPLDRTVAGRGPARDLNVVIILEESLGADHVGALGGPSHLTPQFDALCEEGLLFDNFYATGNRTARALEAVLASLPPIPTESILKRDHSERVYTLATVLQQRGYERLFMTGGRGVFDGVRHFMTANGFNHFREQKDFEQPIFTNAWGVSDEDLLQHSLGEMDRLSETGRPFFATVLTVSNHRPFTYPAGRMQPQPDDSERDGAVQYADWALGNFFKAARQRPWYRKTLFVVMGDHGARVYGKQLFPLRSYRVPVLVLHPDGERARTRSSVLGCSLDIAPTILGFLGGSYSSVFFGRDLNAVPSGEGYALMQHNHSVALLDAQSELTVLDSGRRLTKYKVDPETLQLGPLPYEEANLDVSALFQTAYEMYYGDKCYPSEPRPAPLDLARDGELPDGGARSMERH